MEEAKSVIGVICSSYDSFFDSEKKIANCIMERKREVVDMTVAELAQASGASDASVSRFCRRCGFKGFHQLKMTLARELSEESQASVGNDISRRDIGQSLQNILANKTEEIRQTVAMMDPENLDRILDIIQKARMVQLLSLIHISSWKPAVPHSHLKYFPQRGRRPMSCLLYTSVPIFTICLL